MQTRSQNRQKNQISNPAVQKAMQPSFHHLKIKPVPSASTKDDTKQENALDTKAKNEERVTSVNSNFSDTNAVIKTESLDVHFKQQIESRDTGPDLHDDAYYYSCRSCNQVWANLKSLLDHRRETHLKDQCKNCPIKHIMLEPDINDVNNYCQTCEKRFFTRQHYKQHLNVLQPNVNDPNHYCSVCQQQFGSKNLYRDHLQDAHNMVLQLLVPKDPTILPNPRNQRNYCRVCKRTMTSKAVYRLHCKYSHFMVLEPLVKSRGFKSRSA